MTSDSEMKKPNLRARLRMGVASVRDAAASTLRNVADRIEGPKASFEIADLKIEFDVDVDHDTIWATQAQMAELFGKDVNTIGEHLLTAYQEGEIARDATARKFRVVRQEGARQVEREIEHYNLDAILAVGTRARSPRATQFRQWANRILKDYIVRGYALNESRLRNDPEALQSLAEKVRALRFEEKSLYERVRNCVAMVASDYDGSSEQVRSFFARMQDKFHYAASQQTAHELILARADGSKDLMGMSSYLGPRPTLKDARIAKNYLKEDELKFEHLAGEAFFIFVENMSARGRTMKTDELLSKIDEVFKFNEMPVFPGYQGPYLKDRAVMHAKEQYELFKTRTTQVRYDQARGEIPNS